MKTFDIKELKNEYGFSCVEDYIRVKKEDNA